MKKHLVDPLQTIPGIGPSIADDLRQIGIHTIEELRNQDPKKLYQRMCKAQAAKLDRCLLYVMRCAVYYVSAPQLDPLLFDWWQWTDARMAKRG